MSLWISLQNTLQNSLIRRLGTFNLLFESNSPLSSRPSPNPRMGTIFPSRIADILSIEPIIPCTNIDPEQHIDIPSMNDESDSLLPLPITSSGTSTRC